jgi:hypothetical protein
MRIPSLSSMTVKSRREASTARDATLAVGNLLRAPDSVAFVAIATRVGVTFEFSLAWRKAAL